jgi:hypothetical protein
VIHANEARLHKTAADLKISHQIPFPGDDGLQSRGI